MSVSLHKLNSIVMRLETIEEQKAQLAEDFREVMAEAKHEGFEPKILRRVLAIRKKKPEEVTEEEELLNLYIDALSGRVGGGAAA